MAVLFLWLLGWPLSQDLAMYRKETTTGMVLGHCYRGLSAWSPWCKSCLLQSSLCTVRAEAAQDALFPLAGTGHDPAEWGLSLGLSAPARVEAAGSGQARGCSSWRWPCPAEQGSPGSAWVCPG